MALVGENTVLNPLEMTQNVLDDIASGAFGPVEGMRMVWVINGECAGSTHGWKIAQKDMEDFIDFMGRV
jgi:hypothetical protein